jgi:phosphotransacetylase
MKLKERESKIIFPETQDERVLKAMEILRRENICNSCTLEDFQGEDILNACISGYIEVMKKSRKCF